MKYSSNSWYRKRVLIYKIFAFIAVSAISAYCAQQIFRTVIIENKVDSKPLKIVEYGVTINNTSFDGFDSDGNSYNILSKSAIRNKDGDYNMNEIDGTYYTQNGLLHITSNNCTSNSVSNILSFSGNVRIDYGSYSIVAKEMMFDLNAKSSFSDSRVNLFYNKSSISSDSFSASSRSSKVILRGNVVTHLNLLDF